jgi:hypothetical protein
MTWIEVDFAQFDRIVLVTLRAVGDENNVSLTGDANGVLALGQIDTPGPGVAHVDHHQDPAQNIAQSNEDTVFGSDVRIREFTNLCQVFIRINDVRDVRSTVQISTMNGTSCDRSIGYFGTLTMTQTHPLRLHARVVD